MAHITKAFKSGNTLRISILAGLRYQLQARPGDYLNFAYKKPGVFEVTNLTEQARLKDQGKKK